MKLLQLLALCVQLNALPCSQANFPLSPCPAIFQYVRDSKVLSVYGTITIDGYRNGFNNSLEVILSMPSFAHSTGSLELQNIIDLPRKPARFKVQLSHPLPNVVSIKLNRKVICSGPPAQGHRVTTINLKHYTNIHMLHDDDDSTDVNDDSIDDSDNSGRDETSTKVPSLNSVKFNGEEQPGTMTHKDICGQPANPAVALMFQGMKTRRGEWPWLSAIYFKNSDLGTLQFRCGATLISNKVLLTAAHCLLRENGNTRLQATDILVSLGRYNIMDWTELEAKTINPRALVVHSGFRSDAFDYDIGAIILPNEISYTSSLRPICLWNEPSDESVIVGQLGTVVGWGFTESGIISALPKSARVPIVSEVDCIRSDIGFQLTTSKRTFCAGGQGTGPCQGDSGSGLYVRRDGRWILRGIVSFALLDPDTGKCDTRKYAVYTDVAKYREWLEEQDLQIS